MITLLLLLLASPAIAQQDQCSAETQHLRILLDEANNRQAKLAAQLADANAKLNAKK